jgi:putative tryptophan/tyrosine transport system substrate-binding protein
MAINIARRELLTAFVGSAAAIWPLAARAQQPDRMRRIGVLMNVAADDPQGQARLAAFQQVLQQLGWSDGRNVRIDTRWSENDVDRDRRYAAELVALAPDVVLAAGTLSVAALQRVNRALLWGCCFRHLYVLRVPRTAVQCPRRVDLLSLE